MATKHHSVQDVRKRWARRRSAALSANTQAKLDRARITPEMPSIGWLIRRMRRGGK